MKFVKRNFRRTLSVICAMAIVMSFAAVMFTVPTSAVEPVKATYSTNMLDNAPTKAVVPASATAFNQDVGSSNLKRYKYDLGGGNYGLAVTNMNGGYNSMYNHDGAFNGVRAFGLIVPTNVASSQAIKVNGNGMLVADADHEYKITVEYDIHKASGHKVSFAISTTPVHYTYGNSYSYGHKNYDSADTKISDTLTATISGDMWTNTAGAVFNLVGFNIASTVSQDASDFVVIKKVTVEATYYPFEIPEKTIAEIGIFEENGIGLSKVPDPAFGKEYVAKLTAGDGRVGFTPIDNGAAWEFEPGKIYKINMDLYYTSTSSPLALYFGIGGNIAGKKDATGYVTRTGTITANTWSHLTYTFTAPANYIKGTSGAGNGKDLKRLYFTYYQATLYLKNVSVVEYVPPADSDPTKVALYDNGKIISVEPGTDLPEGSNAYNNERFMGWYDNPNFTGDPVTKAGAAGTKLYARYPSIVIDFNNFDETKIKKNDGSASVVGGVLTYTNKSASGFEIPAYDGGAVGVYKFKPGEKYNLSLVLTGASEASQKGSSPTFTVGSYSTSRETSHQAVFKGIDTKEKDCGPVTSTVTFTYTTDKGNTAGIFRSSDDSVVSTFKIDKIIITQVTGDTEEYFPVEITYNNCGTITKQFIKSGEQLMKPDRPVTSLFFEGWYTEPTFENLVTELPTKSTTLYAKYNYNYIGFSQGGLTDMSQAGAGNIVTDPDDPTNKVAKLYSKINGRHNIEIGNYDSADATAWEMTKTGTKYYFSFKYKVASGSGKGDITVYFGETSAYSVNFPKVASKIAMNYSVPGEGNGEWVTLSGTYTTPMNFYSDRKYFAKQTHLFITAYSTVGDVTIYIDDVIFGEYNDSVPEGATQIFFNTNGSEIPAAFGLPGDTMAMPGAPELANHKFLGWYTDKKLTKPYTEKTVTFGEEDINFYAKWESVDVVIDFTSWDSTATYASSGRYNIEGAGTDKAYLRYNYEQGLAKSTSPASNRARANLNSYGDYPSLVNGLAYKMIFDYYIEESTGSVTFCPLTSQKGNTWGSGAEQLSGGTLTETGATNGWKTGTINFTATFTDKSAGYLGIGVGGDATVRVDNVKLVCSTDTANLYGATKIYFSANSDKVVDPIAGDPGEAIVLPDATRAGYVFAGWYVDSAFTTKFTDKVFGEESITVYGKFIVGKFNETFESFPAAVKQQGVAQAYTLYDKSVEGFDKSNVKGGSTSIFRKGSEAGTKAFTLCRDADLKLEPGQQYTISFYVKPSKVDKADGVINMIGMSTNTGISTPAETVALKTVGDLKVGEWQQVSYTFTAKSSYIGISTTDGNDLYFDNFTVTLGNYHGTSTGDSSVSPIIVTLMIVLAAGAVLVTGKKVLA